MEAVVVPGFLRAADLILQSENDRFRIGNGERPHASISAYSPLIRNYLCRSVLKEDWPQPRWPLRGCGHVQISTRLLALGHQFHAPVLGATLGRRVSRHELGLAVAVGDQAVGGDSFALKVTGHRVGAPLRQPLVVSHPTDDIAVSVDVDGDVGMLAENFGGLVEDPRSVGPAV